MKSICDSFRSQFGGPSVSVTREPGDDNEDLNPSSRYGLLSTLYWHLLTGPLGAYVRLFGDAAAWLTTILVRRMKMILVHRDRRVTEIMRKRWRFQWSRKDVSEQNVE